MRNLLFLQTTSTEKKSRNRNQNFRDFLFQKVFKISDFFWGRKTFIKIAKSIAVLKYFGNFLTIFFLCEVLSAKSLLLFNQIFSISFSSFLSKSHLDNEISGKHYNHQSSQCRSNDNGDKIIALHTTRSCLQGRPAECRIL